jgi:hypothetical protein
VGLIETCFYVTGIMFFLSASVGLMTSSLPVRVKNDD